MTDHDPLRDFYLGILEDTEAPEALLQRVHRWAKDRSDRKLLCDLARHPALPESIDDELGELTDAYVLRAWMQRPGRRPQAVSARLEGERRVTLLAEIAQVEGLDDDAFARLAAADNPRVAEALIGNPDCPEAVLVSAATTLARHLDQGMATTRWVTRTWRDRLRVLELAVNAAPGAASAVVQVATTPHVLEVVAGSPYLDADSAAQACQKNLEAMQSAEHSWQHRAAVIEVTRRALLGPGRDERVERYARQVLAAFDDGPSRSAPVLRELAQALRGSGMPAAVRQRIDRARRSSALGTDELADLVREVVTHGPAAAGQLLVANPGTDAEQVWALATAPWMDHNSAAALHRTRRNDPEAYGALLAATYVRDGELARCSDPAAALSAAIRFSARGPKGLRAAVLTSRYLTPRMLLDAPTSVLSANDMPHTTRRLVNDLIAAALSDDEGAWTTFEGLVGDYDGSIRQVLELCQVLTDDLGLPQEPVAA